MNTEIKIVLAIIFSAPVGAIGTYVLKQNEIDKKGLEMAKLNNEITKLKSETLIQRKKLEEINKKKDILYKELVSANAGLKETQNREFALKRSLVKRNRITNKVKSISETEKSKATIKTVAQKEKSPNFATYAFNPEFLKSVIPIQIAPMANELKQTLGLNNEQTKDLKALLIKKAQSDIDAINPILEMMKDGDKFQELQLSIENGHLSEGLLEKTMEIKKDLSIVQDQFENSVSQVLNLDQIKKYKQYEIAKKKQKDQMLVDFQISQINSAIPNLSIPQQKKIKQIYDNSYNNDDIRIGASASEISAGFQIGNDKHKKTQEIDAQIKMLLSEKQIEGYQNYKKQQMKTATNLLKMFGTK